MRAFTYRHLHFLYSLKSQTKAYLCTFLGNLPWLLQHIGPFLTCMGPSAVQLLSLTLVIPDCRFVSPLKHRPGLHMLPAHLNTCSRHPLFSSTLSFFFCASVTLVIFFPFVLRFADVFGNLKVRKRLDLKPSSPDALYALERFSPNWIKAIMWVTEELYKHCFNGCSYSAVGQWLKFFW